jgi:hypothetical protein
VVGIATTRDFFLFDYRQGQKNFLCSKMFRLALRTTRPPIERVSRKLCPGVKRSEHEADHSPPSNA